MYVQVVHTPTDMRNAIREGYRLHFLAIPQEMEPEVRRATDEIFAGFEYMEPGDDAAFIASYLDSIEEPIRDLRSLGFQLLYVIGSGTFKGVPLTTTEFTVAPSPCYFRVEGDPSALVHLLGAHCDEGHRVFSSEEELGLHLWRSTEAVEQSFEHANTPWCPTCSMASVGQS
jgi:hypothetical protein